MDDRRGSLLYQTRSKSMEKDDKGIAESLATALADTWAMYFKAHSFHWNVTGPLFPQLHEFFGKLYEDTHGAVDDLAERMRAINVMAPFSLDEIVEKSSIKFTTPDDANEMIEQLRSANKTVIASLKAAQDVAVAQNEGGLENFLQDRLDKHAKFGWMLKSSLERA